MSLKKSLDEIYGWTSNLTKNKFRVSILNCPQAISMFSQLSSRPVRRQQITLAVCVALHGLVLGWLLREPEALLLSPASVAIGRNGTSITRLYWTTKSPDLSTHSSPDSATAKYSHERLSQNKLTWKAQVQAKNSLQRSTILRADVDDNSKTQTLSALGHGAQAGLTYGTLARGRFDGDEIRPALPIETSDPVVYPWQLPDAAGNEVIEITIDERGVIINKTVLNSLGSDIDSKCLAALDNWHFQPATRNGSPIPSKQDAIFPFRARG